MNKSITVVWKDEFCNESYCAVLPSYNGLQLLKAARAVDNPNGVEITVYGPAESVDAFYNDYLEDSFVVLDKMSEDTNDDDDEYMKTLTFMTEMSREANGWPRL